MNYSLSLDPALSVRVQIERFLRQKIESGKLPPGERLPATDQLVKQWRVDRTAVQKALARLTTEGLLVRRTKQGTFVRSKSERALIGVLLEASISRESAYFLRALYDQICRQVFAVGKGWLTCRLYDALLEGNAEERKGRQQIARNDIRNYPFRGIITALGAGLHAYDFTGLEQLPMAHMGAVPGKQRFDLFMDVASWARESMEYFFDRGIKKMAYITFASGREWDIKAIEDTTKRLHLPPVEIVTIFRSEDEFIEEAAQKHILRCISKWRTKSSFPEALIVADDIAMRGIAFALLAERIKVPQRLRVLTVANAGIRHYYGFPVARYEFSPALVAEKLVELLWKRMHKEAMPDLPVKIRGRIIPALTQ